jgi:hypothetical protein
LSWAPWLWIQSSQRDPMFFWTSLKSSRERSTRWSIQFHLKTAGTLTGKSTTMTIKGSRLTLLRLKVSLATNSTYRHVRPSVMQPLLPIIAAFASWESTLCKKSKSALV